MDKDKDKEKEKDKRRIEMSLKQRMKKEKGQRILALHKELVKSIFEKIPELAEEEAVVYLTERLFEKLSDEEFVVLWSLPNMVIRVSDKAADYLEERRKLLGLKRDEQGGVMKENEDKLRIT